MRRWLFLAWAIPAARGCSFLASTFELLQNLRYINFFLRFRGPDITGSRKAAGFTFVHNLLHQTGAFTPQPFVAGDNASFALFNGEIYNFHALESTLRPGGKPYRSDGECILEAYAHWGEAFSTHFEGEFAIAIFDVRASRIVVSTDPFGVKPLFVGVHGDEFGIASYRSGLERAGHPSAHIRQLDANRVHVYDFDQSTSPTGRPTRFRLARTRPIVSWDVRQHKADTKAWEDAFEAAVAKRTAGILHGLFLPLSSGYDSGAIHLALLRLGVQHETYSIVGTEKARDQQVISERLAFANRFARDGKPVVQESHVLSLNRSAFRTTISHLDSICEKYTYHTPQYAKVTLEKPGFAPGIRTGTRSVPMLPTDTAAVGVGHICSLAKARGQLTLLTGSGADETMTDYGFNGVRYGMQSQFGGFWPSDEELRGIFPWDNFYNGSQRNYLAKDEYVTGAYGVEGRFPFLDVNLVQEQIYLSPEIKNTYYKAGIQLYMRKHGYPHDTCVASASHPFGFGPGCKKLGFVIPRQGRKLPERMRAGVRAAQIRAARGHRRTSDAATVAATAAATAAVSSIGGAGSLGGGGVKASSSTGLITVANGELLDTTRPFGRVLVLSMATMGMNGTRVRHFAASAAVWGVDFRMLGVGQPWGGFDWMAKTYARAMAQLPPDQLTIVMDSTDAFAQASEAEVVAAFERVSMGKPIVLSLETGCPRTRCTEAPAAAGEVEAAEAYTGIPGLKNVNGGFVMGRAAALKQLWEFTAAHACCANTKHNQKPSAQLGIGRFFTAHPELVAFDRTQQLCAQIQNMRYNQFKRHYQVASLNRTQRSGDGALEIRQQVRNARSRVASCFVHVPGMHDIYRKSHKTNERIMLPFDTIDSALTPHPQPSASARRRARRAGTAMREA